MWARRQTLEVVGASVAVPAIDDLIATKQIASWPRDLEHITLLRLLKEHRA